MPALVAALDEMAANGLLGLRVPVEHGGTGLDDREFRRFQESCARCSGALSFLQTQHQSACGFIVKSTSQELKQRLLPKLATGEYRAGIAFSQLRRAAQTSSRAKSRDLESQSQDSSTSVGMTESKPAPLLTAKETDSGYLLTGTAPWVTGWGLFSHCVTAATLPSGESVFVWHALGGEGLTASPVMRLAAMEVAQTVSCSFDSFFVPSSDVLYVQPGDWISQNDMLNIALQSPFALGCAQAGIDCIRDAFAKKNLGFIESAAVGLQSELDECRLEAYAAMDDKSDSERSLRSRAWAIELAVRCAHAAIASHSGASNAISHPAQRIYREALVFTVSAQTAAIMEATLLRLVR